LVIANTINAGADIGAVAELVFLALHRPASHTDPAVPAPAEACTCRPAPRGALAGRSRRRPAARRGGSPWRRRPRRRSSTAPRSLRSRSTNPLTTLPRFAIG
jgi:hypothetical protein